MNDDFDNNVEHNEPESIIEARKTLNRIQYTLMGFRVFLIVIYYILSVTRWMDFEGNAVRCIFEIIVIFLIFIYIKGGWKGAAILPMIGGIKMAGLAGSILGCGGDLGAVMVAYCFTAGIYQFASMIYILASPKIRSYCQYVRED